MSKQRSPRRPTLRIAPSSLQAEPEASDLATGAQVRHDKVFDIVECIGEGGMGKVYKAFDPVMDRYVAMKVLKPGVPHSERDRFRNEAVLAANFSHPNLPRVLDRGTMESGVEWMTLEFLRGRDLGHVVDRNRNVALPLVLDIFSQTLDALDYMHTRGIVHCDVKPDNIFVTRDSFDRRLVIVKLIDFGICRRVSDPPPKRIAGDPRYMAPEQTHPGQAVDGRTDLYSLGLSLFETLVGRHPFPEIEFASPKQMLEIQREAEVPRISEVLPDLPKRIADPLDGVLIGACAKPVAGRFPSAASMKTVLANVLPQPGSTRG